MNLILTLFWKEFHEHKWKVLSLCAIMMSLVIAGTIGSEDGPEIGLLTMLYGYLLIAPTYVAMGVSASEQSNRSIDFVRGLPIAIWKVGMVRVLIGWVVLLTPLLSSLLLCLLWVSVDPPKKSVSISLAFPQHWSWSTSVLVLAGFGCAWCTVLYAWIVATTVNQKTELRAGMIGLVVTVLLIWLGVVNAVSLNNSSISNLSIFLQFVFSSTPFIWILVLDSVTNVPVFSWWLAMQLCWVVGLTSVAIFRYGKESLWNKVLPRREPEGALPANRILQPPIKSPRAALFWMQYRQFVPIAIIGIVIVLFVAGIQHIENPNFNSRTIEQFGPFIGCVLALIIGTGSFVHELEPQLHTFWRSRPISPKQWFWLKFFAGAVVIVGCYDLPLFAIERMTTLPPPLLSSALESLFFPDKFVTQLAPGVFPVILHLLVYSVAVLAACSIRHPVYAPILATCLLLAVLLGPEAYYSIQLKSGSPWISFWELWKAALRARDLLQVSACVAVAFAVYGLPTLFAATFAGWLIRRDISIST